MTRTDPNGPLRRAARVLLALCVLVPAAATAEWHERTANAMGTRIVVQLWHEDAAEAEALLDASLAEIERIEARMSTYREASEISRVNREAAAAAIPASAELRDLVRRALEVSELSGGAFDITYESVGHLYSLRDRVRPDDIAIDAQLEAIDWRHVEVDDVAGTLRFLRDGVRINLGGIAKGYAGERVVALLRDAGVAHALVSAGGDTRLLGDRRGRPWIMGIRDPDDAAGVVTRLAVADEAISTSGDYERFFDEDGVRYHHILDPSTGRPARGIRSVTVVGPDATLADALSTTLFVLGAEAGLALVERLPDYEAIVVEAGRAVRLSRGLEPPGASSEEEA